MTIRKTGMDRVNELLRKASESGADTGRESAGGSYIPLTEPTQLSQPTVAPSRPEFSQGAPVLDPMRGIDPAAGDYVGEATTNTPAVKIPVKTKTITSAPAVTPAVGVKPYTPPGGTGVLVNKKELPRQLGGGVVTNPGRTNGIGMQFQNLDEQGFGEATNAIASFPGSDKLRSIDANAAIAAPAGISRTGARTAGGGIVVGRVGERDESGNVIERNSGVIGRMPGARSASQISLAESFKGSRFNLRPRRGVEEAGVVAQGAIGAINAKGGIDTGIARMNLDAAQVNQAAARSEAGLERASKEKIAQGNNDAAVTVGVARNLTYKDQLKQRMNTTAFMAQMQQLRDAAKNAVTDADKLAIQQHEDELVSAFQTANQATQTPAGGAGNPKMQAIRDANPGKSDAELKPLFDKYGV